MLGLSIFLEQVENQMRNNWKIGIPELKHKTQINQFLGSMKIGQDLDLGGFDEILKAHLSE